MLCEVRPAGNTIFEKNGGDSHKWRVRLLKRYFKDLPLADLTPAHLAKYRDQRLLKVAPLTVKRDLSVLSSAINTAVIEWSVPLDLNPVSRIKRRDRECGQMSGGSA